MKQIACGSNHCAALTGLYKLSVEVDVWLYAVYECFYHHIIPLFSRSCGSRLLVYWYCTVVCYSKFMLHKHLESICFVHINPLNRLDDVLRIYLVHLDSSGAIRIHQKGGWLMAIKWFLWLCIFHHPDGHLVHLSCHSKDLPYHLMNEFASLVHSFDQETNVLCNTNNNNIYIL